MNTKTVRQQDFSQAVKQAIASLAHSDDLVVICLCQILRPSFETACNPFFVFPVSQREQALTVIMEWAMAFQNVSVLFPTLNECFHWCLCVEQEWDAAMQEGSEDAFLAQAVAAMKLHQMKGRENPYLVVSPQGDIPTHSELLLNA
jgi:hypothetical protein